MRCVPIKGDATPANANSTCVGVSTRLTYASGVAARIANVERADLRLQDRLAGAGDGVDVERVREGEERQNRFGAVDERREGCSRGDAAGRILRRTDRERDRAVIGRGHHDVALLRLKCDRRAQLDEEPLQPRVFDRHGDVAVERDRPLEDQPRPGKPEIRAVGLLSGGGEQDRKRDGECR
jgi:hypothetical protein